MAMQNSGTQIGRRFLAIRRVLQLGVIALALSQMWACGGTDTWLPARDATVDEAFPNFNPPRDPEIAQEAVVRQVFAAPYEDVFRAVDVAAAQALFSIQKQNKRMGKVLAIEVVRLPYDNVTYNRFFYAILLKEQGPRQTRVTVIAKVQSRCKVQTVGLGMQVATLGFGTAMNHMSVDECTYMSKVRWAAPAPSEKGVYVHFERKAEMEQFLGFVRNDLLAAGAI